MTFAPRSLPPKAERLDTEVRKILGSLGIRQGQEDNFLYTLRISVETCHGSLEVALHNRTETELSRTIIKRYGTAVWGGQKIACTSHDPLFDKSIDPETEALLIPILCRIWPLLLACKGVQFPADSLLGQLSDTKFLRANEEQHQHENSFDEVSCGSSATSPSTYDHWSPGKRQVLSTPSTASKSIPGPIRKGAEKRSDVSYPYRNAISREPPSTGRSSLPHSSSARRSSRSAIEQGRAHHMTDPAGEEASLEFGKTRKIGLGSEAMRLPPGNFGQLASLSACLNSTGEGVEDHLPASGTANPTIHGPPVDHYGLWTSEEASTLKTPPGVHADLWDSWIFDLSADADRNNTVSGSAPNCRTHHLL